MIDLNSPEAQIGIKKDDLKISILEAEDKIISIFCENNGGMEFAMPIIRKQFADVGADFRNPTKEDLLKIANKLVDITKQLQGAKIAKEEHREYMYIIKRIKSE